MKRAFTRMTLLMGGCTMLAALVLGRAAWVQLVNHPRLEQMSRRQFQSKVLVQPRRGTILDRNGEPLAINVETDSLAANPARVRGGAAMLARVLSKATDIPYSRLFQRLTEKKEFVWIKRHLSDAELNRLRKFRLIDSDGDLANGLWMVRESQRVYPHGELASHVIGDVNVDSGGVEGIELRMNDRLQGKVVSVSAVKDALGRPSFIDAMAAKDVKDGDPVTLTIDASLQYAVEQELRAAVQKTGSKSGTIIVMNAVNGEILAMANSPTFDPNAKSVPPNKAAMDRRRNRAVTDGYEPGSTMKAILAASALSHGWKLSDQVWGEKGEFKVQGKRISEAEAKEKFDWLSLKKIIQVSSNIGAAKVALKLGADKYLSTIKAFGFGTRTDLGFPGEISGRVPPRREWKPLTLANIGFGQGIFVTPLQMIRAYAAFLNGGWLVQPTLMRPGTLSGSRDEDPREASRQAPRRIISDRVAADVVSALESATEDQGTGVKARLDGYRVAGKTGTAQKVDPETGRYSRIKHVASFIGFALDVEPRVVILTELDEPHGVYFGAETAAPLFREVLSAVANRFGMPARDTVALGAPAGAKNPSAPERAARARSAAMLSRALASPEVPTLVPAFGDAITVSQAQAVPPDEAGGRKTVSPVLWRMPALKGLTAREALRVFQGHAFRVQVRGAGLIQSQVPEEGKIVAEGDLVRLGLSE